MKTEAEIQHALEDVEWGLSLGDMELNEDVHQTHSVILLTLEWVLGINHPKYALCDLLDAIRRRRIREEGDI